MSTLTLYTFEDADGSEQTYSTTNTYEAREAAERNGWLAIANEYEWSDSEPAWDFRPDADDEFAEPMRSDPR